MENPTKTEPNDAEVEELLLCFEELIRQAEELEKEESVSGDQDSQGFADLDPAELEAFSESINETLRDLRGGRITENEAIQRLSALDDEYERMAEQLKDAGEVQPIMTLRAEKEAQLKGLSSLESLLARDAFNAASRGLSSREWVQKVSNAPSRNQQRRRKAVALLQDQGPWPWPREEQKQN